MKGQEERPLESSARDSGFRLLRATLLRRSGRERCFEGCESFLVGGRILCQESTRVTC